MRRALIAMSGGALLAAWEMGVYNRRAASREKGSFSVGSADALIMDSLETGDVILFSRHWTHEHLNDALIATLYKSMMRCDFDRCGMIVHGKLGQPFVLEATGRGVTLVPYEQRVMSANASTIVIRVLTNHLSIKQKETLCDFVRERSAQNYDTYLADKLKGLLVVGIWNSIGLAPRGVVCPDTALVAQALTAAGLQLQCAQPTHCWNCGTFTRDAISVDGEPLFVTTVPVRTR